MGIIKFNNVPSTTPGLEVETFPNYVAPEKEYQVTHVPGRNGDLVVDTKTYKNVPRSYKVSMAVEPPAVSVSGSTASFEATAERALAECKTVISSDVGKVGTTIINSATDPVENNEPYNFRAVPNGVGDRENDTLIGGTVAWNQIIKDNFISNATGNQTPFNNGDSITEGHVYLIKIKRSNNEGRLRFDFYSNSSGSSAVVLNGVDISAGGALEQININRAIGSGTANGTLIGSPNLWIYRNNYSPVDTMTNFNLIDLTQMFGSTIADYIYGLETATAGAGVAWFRNLFPKDYYAYNAGELISVKTEAHKMVGFNLLDVLSDFATQYPIQCNLSNGVLTVSSDSSLYNTGIEVKLPIGQKYVRFDLRNITSSNARVRIVYKDGTIFQIGGSLDKNWHTYQLLLSDIDITYIRLDWSTAGKFEIRNFNLNFSDPSKNGTYEPYEEHIYPLNPALELRGIPKLNSSNKLYYDGDVYSSDGSVIRKYGIITINECIRNRTTSYDNPVFYGNISGLKPQTSNIIIASPFTAISGKPSAGSFASVSNNYDFTINSANTGDTIQVFLRCDSYNDVTTLKNAYGNICILYELSTPVIESTSGLIDNVSIASFDDGADNEPVNSLVVDITATESGSGTKSPTNPYTISGFNSGVVTRCGKNLLENRRTTTTINNVTFTVNNDGSVTLSGTASANTQFNFNDSSLKSAKYTMSNGNTNLIGGIVLFAVTPSGNKEVKRTTGFVTFEDSVSLAALWITSGTNTNGITIKPMIELGETASEFEAYNGNTYTFAFGQTVYGGHFDNKGNLVVTHGFATKTWGNYIYTEDLTNCTRRVLGTLPTAQGQLTTDLCNKLQAIISWSSDTPHFYIDGNSKNLVVFMPIGTSDNTTLQFCYELATPITLAITSQDIPTLLCNNNVFSNTGNIKSLSYPKQVCPFEPAQEVDDHGTEEYIDNREVAIPVGHESKYFTAGKIYNFSWLDEAGLIKEGELNADTGVLTITNGYKVIDIGDLSWSYNASRVAFNVQITDIKTVSSGTIGNMSCSIYTVSPAISSASDAANKPDMTIFQQKDNAFVFIKNSLFTDASTFKSAMHGVKLLYELADPVRTIQLTPVQVESLIGHNVLISESGNISVTPRTYSTYTEKMSAISDWLHSASGYARLEDTYEPDYYRKAYYDEQTDMENIFNEAGQATLNFVCKPQRYLKSGEEPITISSGGLIQNRTRYEAYPILKVTTNNTQGSVAIGNHSIAIKAGAGTDPITIDCELQDAWSGTSNKNSYIVLTDGEFPVIDPGAQTVTFDGGVQSVEVIPRWWTV